MEFEPESVSHSNELKMKIASNIDKLSESTKKKNSVTSIKPRKNSSKWRCSPYQPHSHRDLSRVLDEIFS